MGLPSGYRRLTYVQGTGSQYIDTGFKPKNTTKVTVDFQVTTQPTDHRVIFGSRTSYSSSDQFVLGFAGHKSPAVWRADFGSKQTNFLSTVVWSSRYTAVFDSSACTLNTNSVNNTNSTFTSTHNLYLLANNDNETASGHVSAKLYYCQIYDNGTLIRDFIPCINPSNVAGLYDLIGNKFYPSASSTALIAGPYTTVKTGDILNYNYTGAVESITLPKGQYKFECWGAQGGYRSSATYGGLGGYSVGTITLADKTKIFIYVGGAGNTGKTSGGFNGGGSRDSYNGGGGGSDIRIGQDSLYARVIVAGGGGSDGATNKTGMYGGGTSGGTATQNYGSGGGGGSQTSGGAGGNGNNGSFGAGGKGLSRSSGYGGAGGGGWYGGGGSYPDGSGDDDRGGGGGSGYVYTASTASNYPSGCLLNSTYYLESASMTAGNASMPSPTGSTETGHSGDGYIRITVIKAQSLNIPVNIGNSWKSGDAISANIGGTWKQCESAYVNINGTWKELS